MRLPYVRLALLAAGIAIVVSCDAGPTVGSFGSGISGGPTGTAPVGPPTGADTNAPFVRIDVPAAGTLLNVGDSILVQVTFIDDRKLGALSITGFKETGDTAFGTFVRTVRYTTATAPAAGQPFQPGQTSAIIRRYLQPAQPLDTTVGPMVLMAVGVDSAGNVDTTTVTVQMVTGPKLTITNPVNNDSVPRGILMAVSAHATSASGVSRITIRIQGEAAWPTQLNDSVRQVYPAGSFDVTLTGSALIPVDAPLRGRITVTASAVDVNGNPGTAAPVIVFVRALGTLPPRVFQTVPPKVEFSDFISVSATGDGITSVGRIIKDELGNVLDSMSITYTAPFLSNVIQLLPIGLSLVNQGQKINIISFATDNNVPPGVGFSMQAGTTIPISAQANAFVDTSLVTFGRTFAFPRPGTITDLAVDELRGNVFLSNTNFNLLEVWANGPKTFASGGIAVGALPWGLFVSNNPAGGTQGDTLYVANSGSTTISRVCINPAVCVGGVLAENLAGRLRTRNTVIYQVQFGRDASTGRIGLIRLPDVSYSDRPQYVVQSQGGRVFFSTRPTSAATPGTLRWLDPLFQFADPRQIWQYGNVSGGGAIITYAIFNVDSIAIVVAPPLSAASDRLRLYDHDRNQLCCDYFVEDSMPVDAGVKNRVRGDAEVVAGLDVLSLALTDTTFVAAAGDRSWIAFGEGNTVGQGRVMMVNDPPGPVPGFFSPHITVTDLVHNASEKVFGLAVDRTGLQVTAHGLQTYVAAVDNPFHLRLDGVYDSFDNGAGVTYHPLANSTLSANANRVLFTATSSGVIEIVDVAHYNNRGRLTTKGNLYGPLRATLPLPQDNAALICPGDPNCVILKVYGLSAGGLLVIDLRASDIKPGP
jgi:hypothetical protein